MRKNPVLHASQQSVDWLPEASDEYLAQFFKRKSYTLKTWGRSRTLVHDPHWIGVFKQSPMHTDPGYPRFTHHLIVRVDNFCLCGHGVIETPLSRGLYVVLDTHSPHQLKAMDDAAKWYVAFSIDSHGTMDWKSAEPMFRKYAETALTRNTVYR